ncbi:MAG: hypothetical protein ABIH65_03345 [Nanoarchaeota archaeon]
MLEKIVKKAIKNKKLLRFIDINFLDLKLDRDDPNYSFGYGLFGQLLKRGFGGDFGSGPYAERLAADLAKEKGISREEVATRYGMHPYGLRHGLILAVIFTAALSVTLDQCGYMPHEPMCQKEMDPTTTHFYRTNFDYKDMIQRITENQE